MSNKEMIEEVAKNKSEYLADWEDKDMYKKGFIECAKWQAEQEKWMNQILKKNVIL